MGEVIEGRFGQRSSGGTGAGSRAAAGQDAVRMRHPSARPLTTMEHRQSRAVALALLEGPDAAAATDAVFENLRAMKRKHRGGMRLLQS